MSREAEKCLKLLLLLCMLVYASTSRAEDVVTILTVSTPEPPPAMEAPPTPEPTPTPELLDYPYDKREARYLERGYWSILPKDTLRIIKIVLGEVLQNRVDDTSGIFADSIQDCLAQPGEFLDYDPDAYRSDENAEIADYVMRTWAEATMGIRDHRVVPAEGVYFDFTSNGRHCTVWDINWEVVYEH